MQEFKFMRIYLFFLSEMNDDCKYIFMLRKEYMKFNFENPILSHSSEHIK